jgi:hypothetical protein
MRGTLRRPSRLAPELAVDAVDAALDLIALLGVAEERGAEKVCVYLGGSHIGFYSNSSAFGFTMER